MKTIADVVMEHAQKVELPATNEGLDMLELEHKPENTCGQSLFGRAEYYQPPFRSISAGADAKKPRSSA